MGKQPDFWLPSHCSEAAREVLSATFTTFPFEFGIANTQLIRSRSLKLEIAMPFQYRVRGEEHLLF